MSDSSRSNRLIPYRDGLPRPFPGGPEGRSPGELPETESADPVREAFERGVAEGKNLGREEALRQAEADLARQREHLQEALKNLASLESTVLREYESSLLDVALTAASKIVRDRIDRSDPVAARAVQEAIDVRLNGADLQEVRKALQDEIAEGRIELVEDNSLTRGGCVLDTSAGSIDATVETAENAVRESARGKAEEA